MKVLAVAILAMFLSACVSHLPTKDHSYYPSNKGGGNHSQGESGPKGHGPKGHHGGHGGHGHHGGHGGHHGGYGGHNAD